MQLILPPGTRVTAVAEVCIAETGATLPAGASAARAEGFLVLP